LDPQNIGIAAGVASAAVAALALLLVWYRREGKEGEEGEEERKGRPRWAQRARTWVFAAVAVGVIALSAGGVVFTFKPGTPGQAVSAGLTAVQYRSRIGQICSAASEKAQRVEESKPMKTVLGLEIEIEKDEVDAIKPLVPPNNLRTTNADMIAIWDRRTNFLESIYSRLAQLSDTVLESQLREADQMNAELTKIFQSLGVPECSM
jgi:hypothetical protein